MKVRVEVKTLRRMLKIFEKVAGKSAPVLLKADSYANRLEIAGGADGKRGNPSRYPAFALSVGIKARVDEAGKTAVIIECFRNALKGRSGEVEILDDAERIVLRGHFSDFVGKTNPEEIPTPEVPVGTVKVSVPAQELTEGIELCLPSVHKKGFLLSGINFEPSGLEERLRLVASDGHVLSLTEIPWSAGKDSDFGPMIIPWKICEIIRELIRFFPDEPVTVLGFFCGERPDKDLFTAESVYWKLTAKPVEGVYPDVSLIVPLKGLRVVVDAERFEEAFEPFAELKRGHVIAEMFPNGNALVFAPTEGTAVRIPAEFEAKEVPFFNLKVDMALLARLVKGRKGKMVMHLTKSMGTFQFGNRPWDLEIVGWYGGPQETVFPENGPFFPVPSAKKMAEWREEMDRSGSIPQRNSRRRLNGCKKRDITLEEGRERLLAEIEKLKKLLREAEEANEYLLRQIKELRIENDCIRHGEIPLEPVEGGAKAVLWRKTLIIRDGLILAADGNGGTPIGRYDRETGTGLIESLPVRLRRNGRGWLLVI